MIEILDQALALTLLPSYGALAGACIGIIQLIYIMAHVFHYNYHHYIQHGVILVDGANNKDKIKETLETLGMKESTWAVGYFWAFLLQVFLTMLWTLALHFWYATIPLMLAIVFIILPSTVIKIIARKKRNKVIFEKKLNGTYNEPV